MLHRQFESELVHLEYVVPCLVSDSPLGLNYWRQRITSLRAHQQLLPDGAVRVARLIKAFDKLERLPDAALFPLEFPGFRGESIAN